MTDWITQLAWPWYAAGLSLIAVLLYLADAYDQGLLPRARENLDSQPVIVGSDLDALTEDAEVAWLDSIWELESF